jgi:glutamate-1-semialdehyde 2,1-aminomutase
MRTIAQQRTAELVEQKYRLRTVTSAKLHSAAQKVMPGGNSRSIVYFDPYPTYLRRGYGCRVKDVDENEYVDFVNNYTSLIHGHAYPAIVEALREQTTCGTAFAAPTEAQTRLAGILTDRIASLERVRFCNSGTEATMMAIRAAKAFTGRDRILKLDGGYHGTHDAAVAVPAEGGKDQNKGLFRGVVADVLSIPANDLEMAAEIFNRHGHELAAVIAEPIMGAAGLIQLEREFIHYLSSAAKACGALFILDEVITFRLAYGGAQQLYGVRPDLTALGKVIGGGLPVGAFGGRADVMALFEPGAGKLAHSGTFSGNEATMVAGIAALEAFDEEAIERVNRLGDRLRDGVRAAFKQTGVQGQAIGLGSLVGIHFTTQPLRNYRDTLQPTRAILPMLQLSLLNQGIFVAPRMCPCISTPMAEAEVDEFVDAFGRSLLDLRDEFQNA